MNKELTIQLYKCINENDTPREIAHWHCSSVSRCPRALFYERLGLPGLPSNEPGGGKKLRWRAGHAIEASIRPELEKLYPKLLTNVRFTNQELDCTGEFDGYDPESKTLISVKSVHDFAFITRGDTNGLKEKVGVKKSPKTGKEINDYDLKKTPYIHHEWQEHAYVLLMQDDLTDVLDDGYDPESKTLISPEKWQVEHITYVYITLGGLIACYTTEVQPDLVDRVKNKLEYLNKFWSLGSERKSLPMCTCSPGQEMYDVQDQYCPWKYEGGCCSEDLITEAKASKENENV